MRKRVLVFVWAGGLFFLLAALTALPALAQQGPEYWVHPDYTVRQWTLQDGLPSTEFRALLESSDGYLWIGTHEGLVRFDGHAFTVFNATNTPSLGNVVFHLLEGPEGSLWINSRRGRLTRYHQGRFTEMDVPDAPGVIQLHEAGIVLTGSNNGLVRYQNGQPTPYRRDFINSNVSWEGVLVRDTQGRLWVGTRDDGIYRLDADEGSGRHFTTADGLASMRVHNVLLDRDGVPWFALEGQVVRIVDDQVEPVQRASPWPRNESFSSYEIRMQYQDVEGGVWFTSSKEGWWRYDEEGVGTLLPRFSPDVLARAIKPGPDGLPWRFETATPAARQDGREDLVYRGDDVVFRLQSEITQFEFDSQGNLWLGTDQGLFRLRRAPLRTLNRAGALTLGAVYAILQDQQERVVVASRGGTVLRYDAALTPTVIPIGYPILSLYEDRSGVLWVGGQNVCRVEGSRCRRVELPRVPGELFDVHAMLEDQQGRFWVGSKSGIIQGQHQDEAYTWRQLIAPSGLPNNWVVGILEARDGALFFPTNGDGLLRYDENGDFEALTTEEGLPDNIVHTVYEDREGILWLGVGGQGLCRLDRRGRLALAEADLACIDSQAGLYWDTIFSILEDDQGRFWFNTTNGIFWVERVALEAYFAGESEAVASVGYTEIDGMQSRVGLGRVNSVGVRLANGHLWFPTRQGVVIIDPRAVPRPGPPPVVLETVRVGEEVRPVRGPVALSASERDIEIQYTALEYVHPEDVRFQYQLEGYDPAWRNGGEERFATYTNLSPGRYTFQVRTALGGVWGEASRLTIDRAPFFWQTGWFYGLVAVFFAFVGPLVYVLRVRQLKAREAVLEQTVAERTAELRTANEHKSRFLANISHEFRTPLTLTFGPLDDILHDRFASLAEAKPHIERARRNGSRLLRLINQLLDLSKLDAGALLLHPRRHDLAQHLHQLTALFDSIAETRGIRYATRIPNEPLWHTYDADKIEKVVINLLSNAFKFTPEGSKVAVMLEQEDAGVVRIVVADMGSGIPEEHLPHLFDRFYQVEGSTTRSHEGTGIGLALVKELVELHEGTIDVESTVGFGSRFTVHLPRLDVEETDGVAAQDASGMALPAPAERDPTISGSLRVVSIPEPESVDPPEEATVVLVVEDNADMRAYIRAHLQDHFTVIEAEHGKRGLERALDVVPDLVLSDVMMPEMDGLDLCQALKQDPATSHIPVVLLTARAQVEHRIAGFESGADAYLPKPFNAEELQVRVRTLVEARRRLQARFAGTALPRPAPGDRDADLPAGLPAEAQADIPTPEQAEGAALPSREVAFLEELERLVERRMADPLFSTETLAEEFNMTLRQLRRKLRALLDETPVTYVRRLRLAQAAALLEAGALSVKEVMYAVGFSSDSSFSRSFRQAYGIPPSEYAQQAQQG